MMALSHVVLAGLSWIGVATAVGMPCEPAGFTVAALASLSPDLDHPASWAGRRFLFISAPLSMAFGHRGMTHSFLAVGLWTAALLAYGGHWLIAAFACGYLSHLAGDLLCNSGVPLLWPNRRRFSLRLFNTGSPAEWLVLVGMTAGLGFAGYAFVDLRISQDIDIVALVRSAVGGLGTLAQSLGRS